MLSRRGEQALEKIRLIMGWIAFAQRPLKLLELQSALACYFGLDRVPPSQTFDLCKPFVESGPETTLVFVHSSVQE
jgi:hypothetical protein